MTKEKRIRVVLGADHAGYALKESLKSLLAGMGVEIEDFGTHSAESTDYQDIATVAAKAVAEGRADRGVLICSTGIGMSIVANKVPGVRAALCHTRLDAQLSRRHNDANVLTLAGSTITPSVAADIVKTFLDTGFESGGRHERRVQKIHQLTGM